jgi:hypothetical protein
MFSLFSTVAASSLLGVVADDGGEKTVRFFIILLTFVQFLMGLPASP